MIFNNEQLSYLKIKFRGKRHFLAQLAKVHYNTVCAFLEGNNHNEAVAKAINEVLASETNGDALLTLGHSINQKLALTHG